MEAGACHKRFEAANGDILLGVQVKRAAGDTIRWGQSGNKIE
jgi:hypothetical protein